MQLTARDSDKPLAGLRALIVEDEFLLAVLLEEDLQALGCAIVGPVPDLTRALELSRRERFDVVILDINLNGQLAYPLADELLERGLPVVLLTGYGTLDLPERFRVWPRVSKPYDISLLTKELAYVMEKRG